MISKRSLSGLFRKNKKTLPKGFTLIELVVVIGILAVLLAIVLIAINPGKQFRQANDTKRRSDVNALLNAIGQYAADNKGSLPAGIPVVPAAALKISKAGADICALISPTFISALPIDPSLTGEAITDCTSTYDTHYTVVQDSNARVTVAAPDASTVISVMR
jgi:type IV pilus assembly protein PilA